jgi:hypothetical protein
MRVLCLTPDAVDLEFRPTARVENTLGCKQQLEQRSHTSGVQKLRRELEVKSWRDIGQVGVFDSSVQRRSFIRWGALGAILAGLAWTVSGIIDLATAGGAAPEVLGFVPLDEALYGVALVGMLGGLVGLHTRQASRYGRLGSVGFVASFLGVSLLLVGLALSFLYGRVLEQTLGLPMLGLGFLGMLVGFVLLGAATLRLGVLPRWCALLLIACPLLATTLGDYGGALALGLTWLSLGGTLWLQRDFSALFPNL